MGISLGIHITFRPSGRGNKRGMDMRSWWLLSLVVVTGCGGIAESAEDDPATHSDGGAGGIGWTSGSEMDDPCDLCASGADCAISESGPVCSCPDGYSGDGVDSCDPL